MFTKHEQAQEMNVPDKKLTRNAAECVGCGAVIESKHRHDYRVHECSTGRRPIYFMVDGGLAYIRRGWGGPGLSNNPAHHYIERSEYEQ